MLVSLDIGFSHTKGMTDDGRKVIFPSVWGEAHDRIFNLSPNGYIEVEVDNRSYFIGDTAIHQSSQGTRRMDRDWTLTPEYKALLLTAISELTTSTNPVVQMVSGLPISDYPDRKKLIPLYEGTHFVKRPGRKTQRIEIEKIIYLPQGLASVFAMALDDRGSILPGPISEGRVGVIDIGGNTVNFVTVQHLDPISIQSISINDAGMWPILSQIKRELYNRYSVEFGDHEVIPILIQKYFTYKGKTVNVSDLVGDIVTPFVRKILGEVSKLWKDTGRIDVILISGGGGLVTGTALKTELEQAQIIPDSQWANCLGYLKFGRRLARNVVNS